MARGKVQLEALEPIEGHNVELRLLYAIPRTSNHSTDPHMGMLKLWHITDVNSFALHLPQI